MESAKDVTIGNGKVMAIEKEKKEKPCLRCGGDWCLADEKPSVLTDFTALGDVVGICFVV